MSQHAMQIHSFRYKGCRSSCVRWTRAASRRLCNKIQLQAAENTHCAAHLPFQGNATSKAVVDGVLLEHSAG
jgi:hypothetical protein